MQRMELPAGPQPKKECPLNLRSLRTIAQWRSTLKNVLAYSPEQFSAVMSKEHAFNLLMESANTFQ